MPMIFETVTINADIHAVFDLIARIEEFPLYARILKEVRKIGPDTYRWVARAQGLTLRWDSIVTEAHRPTRLAWRSIRGFANSGAYTLTPIPGGTEVALSTEYSFRSRILEKLTEPLVTSVVRMASADILARVKERLENGTSGSPSLPKMHKKRKLLHAFKTKQHTRSHA